MSAATKRMVQDDFMLRSEGVDALKQGLVCFFGNDGSALYYHINDQGFHLAVSNDVPGLLSVWETSVSITDRRVLAEVIQVWLENMTHSEKCQMCPSMPTEPYYGNPTLTGFRMESSWGYGAHRVLVIIPAWVRDRPGLILSSE
jgi:hypothetical protein